MRNPSELRQGDVLITGGDGPDVPVIIWFVVFDRKEKTLKVVPFGDLRRPWSTEMFRMEHPDARYIPFRTIVELVLM